MISEVKTAFYAGVPYNINEIYRYAGAKKSADDLKEIIADCIAEAERENALNFKVCYAESPVKAVDGAADFGAFTLKSAALCNLLKNSARAVVFAGTLGLDIDRIINRYSDINPVRALIFQALGAERVETYLDLFTEDYQKRRGIKLTPRFSPGYGDLPLSAQKDVFAFLNPLKNVGITLNDSLLMSPSKSVTAIAGITDGFCPNKTECSDCAQKDCEFRREK